ncbi:DNA polymerase eta subunit [Fasciola hepatica]|uniref:DNA polymerase eta n=1 Tax=Fasciola hepatica TaxID=6192 RepID=A0A4E0RL28_FASHE|nr:DNA polymerase eta subunit [Fasciola hepatica]
MNRIVLLIDMDCFYVQVEQRDRPETRNKPCAVAQYNGTTGGGIIAVSYEARAQGVKRGMYRAAGAEVIQCISEFVSNVERASIDEAYIDLTDFVSEQLQQNTHSVVLDTSPTEEAYVVVHSNSISTDPCRNPSDVTTSCAPLSEPLSRTDWMEFLSNSFADGERYALASALTYHIRKAILRRTGFKCSAGIAPNKTLAKLACSLNKPNKQTIVPPDSAHVLLRSTPISKIRNLGGKLGAAIVNRYGIETLAQLAEVSQVELAKEFGEKTAKWLHDLCRGHDSEPVTVRQIPQSIGCSKNFPGRSALIAVEATRQWLYSLASELVERLEADRREYRRQAARLTLHVRTDTSSSNGGFSRVLPSALLASIGVTDLQDVTKQSTSGNGSQKPGMLHEDRIAQSALRTLQDHIECDAKSEMWKTPITLLAFSAGKFSSDFAIESGNLRTMFAHQNTLAVGLVNTEDNPSAVKSFDDSSVCEKQKSSPLRQQGAYASNPTTTNATNGVTSSFFKRLRVAELSVSACPSPTKSPKQSPTKRSNTSPEPRVATSDPSIEPDSNSRSSTNSEAPAVFFTSYTAGDWIVCEECGSRISVWQVPEHSDFHVAQRVQQDWVREARSEGSAVVPKASTSLPSAYAASSSGSSKPKPSVRPTTRGNRKAPVAVGTLDRFIRSSRSS